MIWRRQTTLEALNAMGEGNMVGLLDIQFTRLGDDALEATMPVDSRTHQPFGSGWSGWRLTLTTFVLCAAGGYGECVKRCMPGVAIRSGKLRSSTNKGSSVAPRG